MPLDHPLGHSERQLRDPAVAPRFGDLEAEPGVEALVPLEHLARARQVDDLAARALGATHQRRASGAAGPASFGLLQRFQARDQLINGPTLYPGRLAPGI